MHKADFNIDQSLSRAHFLLCVYLIVHVYLVAESFLHYILAETILHHSRLLITNSLSYLRPNIHLPNFILYMGCWKLCSPRYCWCRHGQEEVQQELHILELDHHLELVVSWALIATVKGRPWLHPQVADRWVASAHLDRTLVAASDACHIGHLEDMADSRPKGSGSSGRTALVVFYLTATVTS